MPNRTPVGFFLGWRFGAAAEGGDLLPAREATKIMREVFTKLD